MDLLDGEVYIAEGPNGKCYIGQARCYKKNRGKFMKHGTRGRWRDHVSEAYSQKAKQCLVLNNAIRCAIQYLKQLEKEMDNQHPSLSQPK